MKNFIVILFILCSNFIFCQPCSRQENQQKVETLYKKTKTQHSSVNNEYQKVKSENCKPRNEEYANIGKEPNDGESLKKRDIDENGEVKNYVGTKRENGEIIWTEEKNKEGEKFKNNNESSIDGDCNMMSCNCGDADIKLMQLRMKLGSLEQTLSTLNNINSALSEVDCDLFIKEISVYSSFYIQIKWEQGDEEHISTFSKNSNVAESLNQDSRLSSFYNKLGELSEKSPSALKKYLDGINIINENGEYIADLVDGRKFSLSEEEVETLQNLRKWSKPQYNYIEKVDSNFDGIFEKISREYVNSNVFASEEIDADKDGLFDAVAQTNSDGSKIVAFDTDNDGFVDRVVNISADGNTNYFQINQPELFSLNMDELEKGKAVEVWKELYYSQKIKPGTDGFITLLKPISNQEELYDFYASEKNYFINGLQNTYSRATNSAQLIANTIDEPVFSVYSENFMLSKNSFATSVDVYCSNCRLDDETFQASFDFFDWAERNFKSGADFTSEVLQAPQYTSGVNGFNESPQVLGNSLMYDLVAGKEVTLYAHSRGASVAYQTVNHLSEAFHEAGLEDKLSNLNIVTLGGYAPTREHWSPYVNVFVYRNKTDLVPTLGYDQLKNGVIPSTKEHGIEFYLDHIRNYLRYQRN